MLTVKYLSINLIPAYFKSENKIVCDFFKRKLRSMQKFNDIDAKIKVTKENLEHLKINSDTANETTAGLTDTKDLSKKKIQKQSTDEGLKEEESVIEDKSTCTLSDETGKLCIVFLLAENLYMALNISDMM